MNFKIFSIILFSTILFSINLHAHNDYGSADKEAESLAKQVVHQFHEEMEGHSDPEKSALQGSIQKWLSNLNLLRVSLDTHRWVQMKYYQDRDKSEYIKNLPVLGGLYLLSHTLETFSGPLGVYIASDLGFSSTVQMLVGSLGFIISIPGLDPICILLFSVSPLESVQKAMSKARILTVRVTRGIKNKFELQKLMNSIFQKKDRLAHVLSGIENEFQIKKEIDLENKIEKTEVEFFRDSNNNFLKLVLIKDATAQWMSSVEYTNQETLVKNKDQIMHLLSKMNLSVRSALKSILFTRQRPFYTKTETLDSSTKVQFSPYAVVLKSKMEFRTETNHCRPIFN